MNTLPAGKYWIGDPCYVLTEDFFNWMKFCDRCFEGDESGRKNEGVIDHQGILFAYFGTAHGDGSYDDNEGNEYGVDAGMISCIPVESLRNVNEIFGTVHEFTKPFDCYYDDNMKLGEI